MINIEKDLEKMAKRHKKITTGPIVEGSLVGEDFESLEESISISEDLESVEEENVSRENNKEVIKDMEVKEEEKTVEDRSVKVSNSFAKPMFIPYNGSNIRVPGRGRVTVKISGLELPLPKGLTLIDKEKK